MPMESALRARICVIGAGNVATHLARALSCVGDIVAIYSRDIANARVLAESLRVSSFTDSLRDIPADADYYIVAVKDDAIARIAAETPRGGVWAHTSGSVPMDVFAPYKERYGVFYPLQTFSRHHDVDVSEVPFLIEGSTPDVADSLMALARRISTTVRPADSEVRKRLHIAAVFACNFANLMWIEADELLRRQGLDIGYLRPLLRETLRKLDDMTPGDAQTGPARRGDRNVIERHLAMLDDEPRRLYADLSEIILKRYNNE